jgi:hypothetical protein
MKDIIARIDALLANTPPAEIEEFEVTRCLRDCRDEIIAARACAEMMLQGTGQRLAESMAERVINGQTVGAWTPVDESLPESGKPVLCSDDFDGWCEVLQHEGLAGWVDIRGNKAYATPTHWMPLPATPTDTK